VRQSKEQQRREQSSSCQAVSQGRFRFPPTATPPTFPLSWPAPASVSGRNCEKGGRQWVEGRQVPFCHCLVAASAIFICGQRRV